MTGTQLWLRRPLSRGAAFTVHLLLSLLIFSSLVVMMLLYWFPGDLFFMDGGWQGLKLVAMVDLVLGPALTLILYKPGKPKLVMDMSMIAMIQIAALGYGFYTTHQQRTVAIVFAEREFSTVSANDKQEADALLLEQSVQPRDIPATTVMNVPLLVSPTPAPEEGGYGKILQDVLNGFPSPAMRNDWYVPIASGHDEMQGHAMTVEQLSALGALTKVEGSLNKRAIGLSDVEVYRFSARYADGVAIFRPATQRIVDYIAIEKQTLAKKDANLTVADGDDE